MSFLHIEKTKGSRIIYIAPPIAGSVGHPRRLQQCCVMVRHDRVPIHLGTPDGPGVRPSGFVIPREAPRSIEVHEFNKRIGTKPLRGRVGAKKTHTYKDANKINKACRGKDGRKGTSTMTRANKKGEHESGSVSEPPSSKLN